MLGSCPTVHCLMQENCSCQAGIQSCWLAAREVTLCCRGRRAQDTYTRAGGLPGDAGDARHQDEGCPAGCPNCYSCPECCNRLAGPQRFLAPRSRLLHHAEECILPSKQQGAPRHPGLPGCAQPPRAAAYNGCPASRPVQVCRFAALHLPAVAHVLLQPHMHALPCQENAHAQHATIGSGTHAQTATWDSCNTCRNSSSH